MNITDKFNQTDIEFYYSSRAPKVPQRGTQWRGPCPLHSGDRDSFSVNASTGMWHCHSECAAGGDIINFEVRFGDCDTATAIKRIEDLLGTDLGDERPKVETAPRPERKVVAVYSYLNKSNQLVYQVVRFEPKSFYQRRPNSHDSKKWVNHLGEHKCENGQILPAIEPIIYNLPAVVKSKLIVIVEGEKDADALKELGLVATCNSGGAGKWRPEFAGYFAGKNVVIVPDMDAFEPGKPESSQFPGQKHALEVARSLTGIVNALKIVELKEHKDAYDYVAAGGTLETFKALISDTPGCDEKSLTEFERRWKEGIRHEVPAEAEKTVKKVETFKPTEDGDEINPNDLAKRVMRDRSLITDSTGGVYEYDGMTWKGIAPKQLESYVVAHDVHGLTSQRRRREASDYIMTVTRTKWVPWRSLDYHEVPMLNGVVDLRNSMIRPHREADYLETVLPHNFNPKAKCPVWMKALEVWFGKDPDYKSKVAAIQEFMGYSLMAHALYKKALMLFGKPDSGKSQVLAAMIEMVGRANTTSISVEDMDDPRKLAPIKGKMLNCLSELRADSMIADGGFKKLVSTGDPVQIDQKYREQETYVPFAKHVIVSNVLPAVNDLTEATHNRLCIVSFNHAIPAEARDVRLMDKLIAEMEGIVAWSLIGAERLYRSEGKFSVIPESAKIIEEHRRGQNPINDFLAENTEEAEDNILYIREIRERFSRWNGRNALSARVITLLRSAKLDMVETSQGKALRGYRWKN